MGNLTFDLQRFAETTDGQVTLKPSETFTLDGVDYTANIEGAVLKATTTETDGVYTTTAITGIASSTVTATPAGKTDPAVNFVGDTAFNFTCTSDGDAIKVGYGDSSINYTTGVVVYSANGLTMPSGTLGMSGMIAGNIPFGVKLTIPRDGARLTFDGAKANFQTTETVKATVSFPEEIAQTLAALESMLPTILGIPEEAAAKLIAVATKLASDEFTVEITGSISYDPKSKVLELSDGSDLKVDILDYAISFGAQGGTIDGIKFFVDESGDTVAAGVQLKPSTDSEAVLTNSFVAKGIELFNGTLNLSEGSMSIDLIGGKLSVTAGTQVEMIGDGLDMTLTAPEAINATLNTDGQNVTIAFDSYAVDFDVKQGGTTVFNAELSINGSFVVDPTDQSVSLLKDTTIAITRDDRTISITATDDAGINIALVDGKIAITPGDGDGALDISIKRGDTEVFSSTVEVIGGSVSIDPATQSVSLTKDTTIVLTQGEDSISVTANEDVAAAITLADNKITFTTGEDSSSLKVTFKNKDESLFSNDIDISGGSVSIDPANATIDIAAGTSISFTRNGRIVTLTAPEDVTLSYFRDTDGEFYIKPDTDTALNMTIVRNGQTVIKDAALEFGGIVSYNSKAQTFGFVGTESPYAEKDSFVSLTVTANNGSAYTLKATTDGKSLLFSPNLYDGKLEFAFPNKEYDSMVISLGKDGQAFFENKIAVDGTLGLDFASQGFYMTEGTSLQMALGMSTITTTANDDAAVKVAAEGSVIVFSADKAGSLNIVSEIGDAEIFNGALEFAAGSAASIDLSTGTLSLLKGTSTTVSFDDYSVSVSPTDDAEISIRVVDGKIMLTPGDGDGALDIVVKRGDATIFDGEVEVSGGTITVDNTTQEISITAGTTVAITRNNRTISITANDDAGISIALVDGKIMMTPGEDDGSLDISIKRGDTEVFSSTVEVSGGSVGIDLDEQEISITAGTTVDLTMGERKVSITTNDEATIAIADENGKIIVKPGEGDGSLDISIKRGDTEVFSSTVEVSGGSISIDPLTNSFGLTQGTTITLTQPDERKISLTALGDASIAISMADGGGLRIAPESGDGDLQMSVTRDGVTRTATIGIDGAIVYQRGGNVSLEEDTTIDLKWEDGYEVAITSRGSSGTIALDPEKGLGITSTDDKLDVKLTTSAGSSFTYGSIQGTLWYNSGKVLIEEGNTLTAKMTTLSFGPLDLEISAIDGDAYHTFNGEGIVFGSDEGTIKMSFSLNAWNRTVSVTGGSVTLTNSASSFNFVIAEGTTVSTDLAPRNPFTFTTSEAGNYVINGHKLTTTTEGVQISVTSNGMVLAVSDAVTCDGLSFTGEGSVTLTADGDHAIGAGVSVTGFTSDDSTIAVTAGTLTIDAQTNNFNMAAGTTIMGTLENGVTTTITATADIDNAIMFGDDSFTIAPTSADALNITISSGDQDIITVTAIDGSLTFKDGIITAADGTKISVTDYEGYNATLTVDGSELIVKYDDSSAAYIIGDGSAILDWTDGKFWEIRNDTTLTDNYEGKAILSAGATFNSKDDLAELVLAEAGTYTLNGQTVETSANGVEVTGTDDGLALTPGDDSVTVNGMTFTGDGTVTLTEDVVKIGAGVNVTGFDPDETFVLYEKGSVTVNGKTFELIEDVASGVTVTGAEDGFLMGTSGEDYVFTEKLAVAGDSTYSVQASSGGLEKVRGISADSTITGGAIENGEATEQYFNIETETEGDFTIGERVYNISGDSSVVLEANFENGEGFIRSADDLTGTIRGDFTVAPVTINGGDKIIVHGDDDISIATTDTGLEMSNVDESAFISSLGGVSKINGTAIQVGGYLDYGYISAKDDTLSVYSAYDATITTDAPEKVWVQMANASMTFNGNRLELSGDKEGGVWFGNKEIVGLDEGASLTVGEAGTYSTEVVTLEAQAGDVIVGLGDEDAYIYDESNPLITKQTSTEELIDRFKPDETFVVRSESRGRFNHELDGDDLAIVEDTPAWVNIDADGDTIVSQGRHVNVNMGDGNTWLFPLDGKMTLEGYDHSTKSGFGTNYADIEAAIERGAIKLDDGKITLGSAQIDMGSNDLINFYDRDGDLQKVGYTAEGNALDASDVKDDLLLFAESYSTVESGAGDDTIYAGAGAHVDAGAGSNVIELAPDDERYIRDDGAIVDINDGDNAIANFKTGFDYTSDAVSVNTAGLSCFFDGKDIVIQTADGDTTVLEDVADGADFAQFKVFDGTTYNAAIAQEGEFIKADGKEDVYIGENSGVDFSDYDGTLLVDLDDGRGTVGKNNAQFFGIRFF
ncbi:MAG: hypothetical protein SR2Q5_04545 [Quinella sp. 2Q5]|nr:hypothetical protein [Quinella sp. 2Q5]